MTVLEATNKLIEFFAANDFFELEKDFSKVVLVSLSEADKAAIIIALEELEKQRFVIKKVINEQEFWVLLKPLAYQVQELQISLMTAIAVSTILNKYIEKEEDKVSPLRISEQDIFNLTVVATKQA